MSGAAGAGPAGVTPADWAAVAREHERDATILANAGSWRNAYGLAGLAVECALKYCIMRRRALDVWPARRAQPDFYSHDLGRLASLARLRPAIEAAGADGAPVEAAWIVAKDFAIARRYADGQPFPAALGRDMVAASCGTEGLVEWLIRTM